MIRPRRSAKPRGASGARQRLPDRFAGYLHHHRQSCSDSLIRLAASPIQSLMTVMVIAIALALPAALHTLVDNLGMLAGDIDIEARMSLFLRHDAGDDDVRLLLENLESRSDLTEVTFIDSDQALADFRRSSGLDDLLVLLDGNPLPATILVRPNRELGNQPDSLEKLAGELAEHPLVDDISADTTWLRKLQAAVAMGREFAMILGAALALGVLLIIGNTIRLAIENRRDEITVVKLVGGTDSYVRRPFLYTGFWFGFSGALAAWLLVWLGIALLADSALQLAALYESRFQLQGPGLDTFLVLVSAGSILGLGGAWLAVRQHANAIEPE